MLGVCRTIEKIAPTETTVLLLGESGTGKEVLARALHDLSPRKDQDFIAINCAAIPENLLESELFGYEKGAFTGASKQTKGKIEFADKGTLFLDEIGDLSAALQAKLLRFLQERVIERVGGRSEIAVDTRIICATHQDLRRLIDEGGFREDLFYRISEMTVNIPALREREGDAVLITRALLDRFESLHKGRIKDLSEATILAINKHDWSGNVRELENRVKRAVIMADGNVLEPEDLELPNPGETVQLRTLREYRDEADLVAVKATLAYADGNIGRVAEILGISRPTVYQILRKFNIDT
jgi:two-component system NtrC family response regulator